MKIASIAFLAIAASACESTEPNDHFAVAVAPLELAGIDDVCYGLTVSTATDTVWSKSGLCASQYGDGTSALTYIGTCDADGGAHQVQLVLESIVADGETLDDQTSGNTPDFNNPCPAPAGCVLPATCEENADTLVEFNLTVMRRAQQGFFDIAVNFEDVFCSAKADCVDDDGPIELLHNPRTDGERDQTLVLGLTCAGGADADTQLHWLDAAIVCGATRYDLLAANDGEQGLHGPIGAADSLVFEHAYYFGEQALAPYLGLYFNMSVGLDTRFLGNAAHTNCRLEASATVSDGPLEDGHTPAATRYPIVRWSFPINEGSQLVCTQHPLDGGNGLATDYTPIDTEGEPVRFTLDGDGAGHVTLEDLADQVPNDPGPIASPELFITSDGILRLAYLVDRQADRLYRFFLVDGEGRAIGRSSAGFSIGQREGSYAITAFTNCSYTTLATAPGTTYHVIVAPEPSGNECLGFNGYTPDQYVGNFTATAVGAAAPPVVIPETNIALTLSVQGNQLHATTNIAPALATPGTLVMVDPQIGTLLGVQTLSTAGSSGTITSCSSGNPMFAAPSGFTREYLVMALRDAQTCAQLASYDFAAHIYGSAFLSFTTP